MWGFKAICINILNSEITDIMTLPAGLSIDINLKDSIQFTNTGYKFSSDSNICSEILINKRLLEDITLSDEEIAGLLLHEIGHSFVDRSNMINYIKECQKEYIVQRNIDILKQDIKKLSLLSLPKDIGDIIKHHNLYRVSNIKMKKLIKNLPGYTLIKMNLEELKITKQKINNHKYKIHHYSEDDISRAQKEKESTLKNLDSILSSSGYAFARSEERLSDDFASMYGLGAALASALIKLGNPYHNGKNDKKFTDIDKQCIALFNTIAELQYEHPGDCDRVLAMIDALEQDYKTLKLNSKIKNQMKQDILAIKSIKHDITYSINIMKEFEKYTQQEYRINIQNNTETPIEKIYNDRNQINQDYYNCKEEK